jgi:predicted ABC-type ATPase
MADTKPKIIMIAGCNGAGKSTLAPHLLRDAFNLKDYVNADTIAQGLSAFAPENAAIEAGQIMLDGFVSCLDKKNRLLLKQLWQAVFTSNLLKN